MRMKTLTTLMSPTIITIMMTMMNTVMTMNIVPVFVDLTDLILVLGSTIPAM